MKKRLLLILALTLLLSADLHSQPKEWTLTDCMQYAVEHSTRIKRKNSEMEIAKSDYRTAIAQLLPSVESRVGLNYNYGRGLDAETNSYTNINSLNNNYSLYSSMTLFDGFASIFRIRMQQANIKMGIQNKLAEENSVALETMEAFFHLLYCEGMVKAAEQQVKDTEEAVRQVKRMEELGLKSLPDVADINAKEAEDRFLLTQHRNLSTIALIQLKEKMSYPLEEPLKIINEGYEQAISSSLDNPQEIYQLALTQHPMALSSIALIKSKKEALKMDVARYFPRLSLNAGIGSGFARYLDGNPYTSFQEQIKNKRGSYIGFSLTIPIFDGLSTSNQRNRSKVALHMAQYQQEDNNRKLYSEITQAVADMNGQADEYRMATKQLEATGVAYEVNLKKYKEGLISSIELAISANRRTKAVHEQLNARFKYQMKRRLVDYYKGQLLIEN